MATPAGPQISMLDMRTHITRGSNTISMSEVRTRYGGSGQINFSTLYKSEGWAQTNGQVVSKYLTFYGWRDDALPFACGSVTPDESGGQVIIVTGRNITGFSRPDYESNSTLQMSGGSITGYNSGNITRFVSANVSRTFTASGNTALIVNYAVANTGTIHCMVKF